MPACHNHTQGESVIKIIEALKRLKDLTIKAEDLRTKIGQHSADLNYETPVYENQKDQVDSWLQSHSDILKEILRLRTAVQRTNLETKVTIDLNGKGVTHSIAEWIHRRRDLAAAEATAYAKLTDRNLKEGMAQQSSGQAIEVKIRRYYDAKTRDENISKYKSEPHIIDSTLEVTNAVTDLIE